MKLFWRKGLLVFLMFSSVSTFSVAQEYSLRDQTEITYRAQLTLNLYKDFLNTISISGLATDAEIKELIQNSYQDPVTRIFYSKEAIIEDDVNPSNRISKIEQDKTVSNYLSGFDLLYQKSEQETVEFSDFQFSNLKFGSYLYLRVRFTSHFNSYHKEDSISYQPVERLAEVRAEKIDKEWRTFISSIVYYDSTNHINSTEGDVVLDTKKAGDGTLSQLLDQSPQKRTNSVTAIKEANQFSSYTNSQDSIFNHYFELGKEAMELEKFDEAFAAFSEALHIQPLNIILRQKINELNRAQNRKSKSEEKKYDEAVINAERAQIARNYVKAKNHYLEALRIRPQEISIKERIDKLDKVIQQMAFLESKFNIGEYKEAIKDYNRAIKENKANADYYYGRGKCYEKLEDTKNAIKDFSTAISLDGNFVDALSSRARLYILTEQPHKAIADYTLIISNPDYAITFYPELAKIRKAIGDYKGAIEDYNAVIKLNPEEAAYYYERGLLYYLINDPEEATRSYTTAIEKDEVFTNAYYQRGLSYLDLNNPEAASLDFAKGRELGLDQDQVATIENRASTYFNLGERDMKKEDYEGALGNYADAILVSPALGSAWLRKGDAYYNLLDYERAINHYHRAIEFDSISVAYYKRGMAYQQLKDHQSALKDFKHYIPIGGIVVSKLEEERKQGNLPAFLESKLAEDHAEAVYYLGFSQYKTGQFTDALINLDKAVDIKKKFPKAFFTRGATQYALKEYKKSIKDIEESIKLGHSNPETFYTLGLAYEGKGKIEEALTHYSKAINLDQDFEEAFKQRSICYKNLGQYKQALQDIKMVFQLNEKSNEDVQLVINKGLLELYQSNIQEANLSFDQAIKLEGNAPWALYGKACALAYENKLEESIQMYQRAFQTRQIQWSAIKKDPLINPVKKQKAFKELVKASL